MYKDREYKHKYCKNCRFYHKFYGRPTYTEIAPTAECRSSVLIKVDFITGKKKIIGDGNFYQNEAGTCCYYKPKFFAKILHLLNLIK